MAGANRRGRTRDESNESHDELWKTFLKYQKLWTDCASTCPARGVKSRKINAFSAIRYMGAPNALELNATFPFCGHFSTG